MTGFINDPLGQTHSLASSEHCFLLFCFARFEKWGWMYGRTTCAKTIIPTVTVGWQSGSIIASTHYVYAARNTLNKQYITLVVLLFSREHIYAPNYRRGPEIKRGKSQPLQNRPYPTLNRYPNYKPMDKSKYTLYVRSNYKYPPIEEKKTDYSLLKNPSAYEFKSQQLLGWRGYNIFGYPNHVK